jgi:SAM-dependent methyltransferase
VENRILNSWLRECEGILRWFKNYETKNCINSEYFQASYERYLANLKFFNELATKINGRILELGAWPYHFTYILKKLNLDVTAIDFRVSEGHKVWLLKRGVTSIECNVEKDRFPFLDESFQFVFFFEVLEHLYHNPLHTFLEINRVLKKGGLLFISTPNKDSLIRKVYSFLSKYKEIYESPFELYRYISLGGRPGHFRLYNRLEIEEFLINTGFVIEKVSFSNFSETMGESIEENMIPIQKRLREKIFKKRNYLKATFATLIELLMKLNRGFQKTVLVCARKNKNVYLMDLK